MKLELLIPPPVVGLIIVILMGLVAQFFPQYDFDFAWRIVFCIALVCCGLLIDVLALIHFHQAKTTINPMKPERTSMLVTTGIFQLSRNPMYLGLTLIVSAAAFYIANSFALIMVVLFVFYITCFQILPEEKIMHQKFEESFQQYKSDVRRWI